MGTTAVGVAMPMARVEQVVAEARAAEDHGLDHVSLSDVLLGDGKPSADALTAAAAVAAVTERVLIEFGVLVLPMRHPVWTAQQLATLQHLSGGRIVLGAGTGGFPGTRFWRAVGAPEQRRVHAFDAALRRLPSLLDGTDPDVTISPAAPVPPILVGGGPRAVRAAERHGTGWFPSLVAPSAVAEHAHRVPNGDVRVAVHAALGPDRAEAHARLVRDLTGRMGLPPDRAEAAGVVGGPQALADRIAAYAAAGARSVTVALDGADPLAQLGAVARARDIAASGHTSG